MKTSELTGAALDWAVAKCEGLALHKDAVLDGVAMEGWCASGYYMDPNQWIRLGRLRYSSDWNLMGPIIEREGICLQSEVRDHSIWKAQFNFTKHIWLRNPMRQVHTYCSMRGSSALIAAARCYVMSKLGDTVDVPEELC